MSRFASIAAEQVAELAGRCAESGRLSRGRVLFRNGSVSDLSALEGSVTASVRGSEGDRYETSIGTALAPPGVIRQVAQAHDPWNRPSIDDLIDDGVDVCPREIDLAFACSCADWEEPCKHVVAVFLAFADRIDLDEAELLRWRGIELLTAVDGESVNERSEVPTRPPSPQRRRLAAEPEPGSPADEPGDRSAKLSELEALLGDTVMRVPAADGSNPEPQASTLEPAIAAFLGVGMTVDPVEVSEIAAPPPLFTEFQLGPLADLGPELAIAVATITGRLSGSTR